MHHSDTHVDVTTGTRHHPIDFVCRETFALIGVIVTGRRGVLRVLPHRDRLSRNHSNVALPVAVDKALSWWWAPNMHKFHHRHEVP